MANPTNGLGQLLATATARTGTTGGVVQDAVVGVVGDIEAAGCINGGGLWVGHGACRCCVCPPDSVSAKRHGAGFDPAAGASAGNALLLLPDDFPALAHRVGQGPFG